MMTAVIFLAKLRMLCLGIPRNWHDIVLMHNWLMTGYA